MRKGLVTLLAASAILSGLAACTGGGQPAPTTPPPTGSQLLRPSQAFDLLRQAGMTCPSPKLVSGAAVCGPADDTNLTVSVAVYPSPAEAKRQFLAHCEGDTWNLFRNGQNWRGALSTATGRIDPAQARTVAAALGTDAVHGCGGI